MSPLEAPLRRAARRLALTAAATACTVTTVSGCSLWRSEPPAADEVRRDVQYVSGGGKSQSLDLFLPARKAGAALPLVIFIHGGRWSEGDKSMLSTETSAGLEALNDLLLRNGYAVASINYRLAGEAKFPANIHDVKASVRYLRANADSLGLDPKRFAVIGESAGGHLALLLGMSAGDSALEGTEGTSGVSSEVQAVVSYYGISNIVTRSQQASVQSFCPPKEKNRTTSSDGRMLGAEPSTTAGQPLAKQASAATYVDPSDPPTLLFHGRQDCNVPNAQSQEMHKLLKSKNVPTELTLIDAPHADPRFYSTPALREQLIRFLATHLTGA